MKVCSNPKCSHNGTPQPFSNFHKNRTRKDGYNPYCKDCKRAWVKTYSGTKRDKEAKRKYKNSPKGIASQKRYEQSEPFKALRKRYKKQYPNRIKARSSVNHAVRAGKIPHISTLQCTFCNLPAKHYHHHLGYSQDHWLDVIPVCINCHRSADEN